MGRLEKVLGIRIRRRHLCWVRGAVREPSPPSPPSPLPSRDEGLSLDSFSAVNCFQLPGASGYKARPRSAFATSSASSKTKLGVPGRSLGIFRAS
jgi:hypothetical protein